MEPQFKYVNIVTFSLPKTQCKTVTCFITADVFYSVESNKKCLDLIIDDHQLMIL